jgi:hypothetical protein
MAVHAVVVGHDTSPSQAACSPATVGVACTDHAVPSQRSASVCCGAVVNCSESRSFSLPLGPTQA